MADTTKNIVNQYSYNSPYVKTLTEEQVEVLYPTGTPVPKDLLLHIKNAQDNSIDYFIIGNGKNKFTDLPKYSTGIKVNGNPMNQYNLINFSQDFSNEGNTIKISLDRFPSADQVTRLANKMGEAAATLFLDSKQIYKDEDSKYNFNEDTWKEYINDSNNGYDKTKSFFLYNFLNNIYQGKFENNNPLRFYALAPLNSSSNMEVQFSNSTENSQKYSCNSMDSSGAWIFKNNNNEIFRVYFAPIASQQDNTYQMTSIYPYIYIKVIDQEILNKNYTKVKIFSTDTLGEYNNADLYWVTCENGSAIKIDYWTTINLKNDIMNSQSSSSGSGVDPSAVRDIIAYLLTGSWAGQGEAPSLTSINFNTNLLNEKTSSTGDFILQDLIKQIGARINQKANTSTIQNDYVKKPNKAQQTVEDPELWTTISGTYVDQDNNNTTGTYEFKVLDYKIPSSNQE